MRLFLALLVLMIGATQSSATNPCAPDKPVPVGNGFYTGATLNELLERDLANYAAGYADAFSAGMMIGAREECYRKLRSCVVGRSGAQLAAIVRKYLRDHPAEWHHSGGIIVHNAIFADCLAAE
jgi:hypothetical protein